MEGRGAGAGPRGRGTDHDILYHLRLESLGPSFPGQRPEGEETTTDCRENGLRAGEARQQGHHHVVLVDFRFLPQDRQTRGLQTRVIRNFQR